MDFSDWVGNSVTGDDPAASVEEVAQALQSVPLERGMQRNAEQEEDERKNEAMP